MQPTVGTVRIDGARLTDWDQDELGQYIGYMPQEPSLFEGTIKENISRFDEAGEFGGCAADRRSRGRGRQGSRRARAHPAAAARAMTRALGLMGAGLSAGQAQRMALARALYGEPRAARARRAQRLPRPDRRSGADHRDRATLARAARRSSSSRTAAACCDAADRLLVLEEGRPKMIGPGGGGRRAAGRTARTSGECGMSDALVLTVAGAQRGRRSAPRDPPRRDHRASLSSSCSSAGRRSCRSMPASMPPGTIAVSGNRQSVQHRDGGVVTAIHVREGQHVRAGEVLIELSAPELQGVRARADQRLSDLARAARAADGGADRQRDFAPPAEFASLSPADRELAAAGACNCSGRRCTRASGSNVGAAIGARPARQQLVQQQAGYVKQREALIEQQRLIARRARRPEEDRRQGLRVDEPGARARARPGRLKGQEAQMTAEYRPRRRGHRRNPHAVAERSRDAPRADREPTSRTRSRKLSETLPKLVATREQLQHSLVRAPATGQVVGLRSSPSAASSRRARS